MRSYQFLLYGATIILTLTWIPLIIITVHKKVTAYSKLRNATSEKQEQADQNPDMDYWNHPMSQSDVAERMERRRENLKQMCAETGLDMPGNDPEHKLNAWEYLINKDHNLIWCNVFKAASTSWLYNFNILAGYTPSELRRKKVNQIQVARRKYIRPQSKDLIELANSSYTFIIARHPFERLLSAYRDKILRPVLNTPHHKLGFQIIKTYRKKNAQVVRSNRPTFPEFVSYIIDEYKRGARADSHWIPIHQFCTPCLLNFNIIMKFETLHEDSMYLIEKANIGHLIKPEWKNPNKELVKTNSLMRFYYSQLSESQKNDLYEIYRYDFKIFDYSKEQYLT